MLAVVVSGPHEPRRYAVGGSELTIGSADGNDVVLAGVGVDPRHARCIHRDGDLLVVDLQTRSGTRVNGRPLAEPSVVQATDEIRIGDYALQISHVVADDAEHEPYIAVDPVEDTLLRALAARDRDSRAIYADWLEQRGDHARAEYLRVQETLAKLRAGDPAFRDHAARLAALAVTLDLAWRVKVATPAVERCLGFELPCPMEWSQLAATDRDDIRHCGTCKREVFYALTVGEARRHAAKGRCVALDVTSARWPDDLADPYGARVCSGCGRDVGIAFRGLECPECGSSIERRFTRGKVRIVARD
jgi:uncharacterized protein (TIGR02996 family)